MYNSIVDSPERAAAIKNTTMFYEDLKANTLPQWMFITPNMTSDAHGKLLLQFSRLSLPPEPISTVL